VQATAHYDLHSAKVTKLFADDTYPMCIPGKLNPNNPFCIPINNGNLRTAKPGAELEAISCDSFWAGIFGCTPAPCVVVNLGGGYTVCVPPASGAFLPAKNIFLL
jgi:hypothetical protein